MFTEDQLRVILGMPDFGDEEEGLQRQYQMANQLRNLGMSNTGSGRMDWASQMARAAGGIGGGYFQNQSDTASKALSGRRRKLLEDMFGGGGGGTPNIPSM